MRHRQIAFRVDASVAIGTGHLMRCLALAGALRQRDFQCSFLVRDLPRNLEHLIADQGHILYGLTAPARKGPTEANTRTMPQHADWLTTDWATDAHETQTVLEANVPGLAWLAVDHYALDNEWERAACPPGTNMLVVDDLADRRHACAVLVDQSPSRSAMDYAALVDPDCEVLAGPTFALLRPEFARMRASSLRRRSGQPLRRVLVFLGGVDKDNTTTEVLRALKACNLPDGCIIDVVLGAAAPWKDAVEVAASNMPWPTSVRFDVADMANLMSDADLAIGAGGVAALERCCLGLPAIIVILADNQRPGARGLAACGAALVVDQVQDLSRQLPELIDDLLVPPRLTRITASASEVTDGGGAQRVIATLLERSQ